jgi:hypothetical protein
MSILLVHLGVLNTRVWNVSNSIGFRLSETGAIGIHLAMIAVSQNCLV